MVGWFVFQVLHPASAGHSPLWTTTLQERDCERSHLGQAGAPRSVVASFSPDALILALKFMFSTAAF